MEKKLYKIEVVMSRTGTVQVMASDGQEAKDIANALPAGQIDWDDDFVATDWNLVAED